MKKICLFGSDPGKIAKMLPLNLIDDLNRSSVVVTIGCKDSDFEISREANVSIVFGDVEKMLFEVCDYAIYDERKLVDLLKEIRREYGE